MMTEMFWPYHLLVFPKDGFLIAHVPFIYVLTGTGLLLTRVLKALFLWAMTWPVK